MLRLTRLFVLVLLAVSGCTELRGCGTSEPAPLQAAVAPDAGTPQASTPGVAPPPREARYAKKWLVIVHSSSTPGEGSGVLEALKATGLHTEPLRLSTNAFKDLRPCLEVVVAKVFETRAEAEGFREQLSQAAVTAYVKNAGPLEPERGRKDATCQAEAEAHAARAEALNRRTVPRFVESHVGRTFMLLGEGTTSVVLEPMDVRRSVWMAPAEEDPTGLFLKGETVDLYGAAGLLQAGCAVKGFAWINRGVPHFGYFQQEPPPEAPGCGRPWAFAELDCAVAPDTLAFALPAGTKAPVFFAAGEGPPAEVLAAEETALRRSERFAALRSEGSIQAEQVQERLNEEVRSFRYASGSTHAVFTVARFRTGEGNSVCGGDYNQQVTRAVVRGPGGSERTLPAKELVGEDVVGVLDLEGDGKVELLVQESWPAQAVRLLGEDGSELAGAVVENCDCGC
ncbi:hypothetical protein ATI61_103115 [Archangium gephyra]|uniref:Lipoprotein n=1 Tax=Archangium gephyra TaxID=48 RepID=A0AAC8TD40_9BACT|nr:hypothetical protein [Archangium gephyra]AKJ01408.1 Hypothetical protein AA314_03034 [Archangium gephyra]REG34222.1 hypothetical protein ATI61_103115 [Archangium gephyra]